MKKFILLTITFVLLLSGQISLYASEPVWNISDSFMHQNISTQPAVKVYAGQDAILIETVDPVLVEIYTITGNLHARRTIEGYTSIPARKGIYLVRIGEKVQKIIVK